MIRLLIVDDQELVRYAIGAVLKAQPDIDLVGAAATAEEALALAAQTQPAVVLTETVTPALNGIATASQILALSPATRAIALTTRHEEQIVCQAMQARFSGYVLKSCPFNLLVDAIHAVAQGQMFLCPEVVGAVVASHVRPAGAANSPATHGTRISEREREVLKFVAEGYSTKETADRLSISLKTVETHRRRVMSKLKLFSVAQLTKYAIREGLTSI